MGRFLTTICPKCGNQFAWREKSDKPPCPFCEQEFDEGAGQIVETVEVIENMPPTVENEETGTLIPKEASETVHGSPEQDKPQI